MKEKGGARGALGVGWGRFAAHLPLSMRRDSCCWRWHTFPLVRLAARPDKMSEQSRSSVGKQALRVKSRQASVQNVCLSPLKLSSLELGSAQTPPHCVNNTAWGWIGGPLAYCMRTALGLVEGYPWLSSPPHSRWPWQRVTSSS
jgi:hypothetical protein